MTKQTEVLIVGGGMAGICAALSAAETGKEVILLEKSALLGGNATKSNVGTICGAYYRSLAGNIIPAGNSFTRNFIKEILHRHQLEKPINYYNGLHLVPYEWSILLEFLNNQLAKWDNIKVYLNTEIESVLNADNRINTVQTKISGEQITFTPQSIVDCSGNGVVSQLAELEHLSSHQYQAATQVFRLTGVKPTSEFSLNMAIKKNMMVLIDENEWPESFKVMSAVPGSLRKDKVDIKLTLPDNITDNSAENVKLLAKAKGYIHEILPVLKDKIESLREAEIERISRNLG